MSIGILALALSGALAPVPAEDASTVVFVCEHGSVKSLIAKEWFERRARERGVSTRAISRGLTPDESVPPPIVDALRRDGFDVASFRPQGLAPADLAHAARVVAIGIDPAAIAAPAGVPVESWDAIPPATQRYDSARDALRARIEALLAALERPREP